MNRRFFQNLALNPCWDCLDRPDRSDRSMQADSLVSRNKPPLELEPIRNLGYVSCRVFLTIETSPYTQVEHTQVDRAEAQFKLKTIIAKSVKQTEMKMMQRRHGDLFYRSSDSPRAPTCESYSPLRKLMATARSSYLLFFTI